jgi:class 3 adenylate cyclase
MARKRSRAGAGTTNASRRLVVVVGVRQFSALVEADERRVLAACRALRQAIDPLIVAGGGRIFKALGDGLLVEFTGPVDATRTALAVQAAVARARAARGRAKRRCASSCAAPSTWAKSPSRAPTFSATASTSCRACRSMRRSAAC